jgi:NADH:ubiquinone oxidoreductase subunit E
MLEVIICVGSACHLKGSYNVIQEFQQIIEEKKLHDRLSVKAAFCMKQCQSGVSVSLGDTVFCVLSGSCREFFDDKIVPRLNGEKGSVLAPEEGEPRKH